MKYMGVAANCQQSWSCDPDAANTFVPILMDPPHKIWV